MRRRHIHKYVEEQNGETSVAARVFKPQQEATAQSGLKVPRAMFDVLKDNISLSRRKACQVGAIFGLAFLGLMPSKIRRALAAGDKPLIKERAMKLLAPMTDGHMSLEKAIKRRRTVRSFGKRPITKQQFAQILWASQGITEDRGFKRAAPSGGALYPADVYAVVGRDCVEDLTAGVYRYKPGNHSVLKTADGDRRKDVAVASLRQMWMADAAVLFVVCAEYERITVKYGDRGIRYALIEVGHIGQNIFLQSETLGLATGIVGAFNDRKVSQIVKVEKNHEPLIVLPVGWRG